MEQAHNFFDYELHRCVCNNAAKLHVRFEMNTFGLQFDTLPCFNVHKAKMKNFDCRITILPYCFIL